MTPAELPAPDTIIEYPNGTFGPLMFHYVVEGNDLRHIAREMGFECKFLYMENDLPEDDPIYKAYFDDGSENATGDWQPTQQDDGWKLVAKYDTEDGPVAIFVRAIEKAQADG